MTKQPEARESNRPLALTSSAVSGSASRVSCTSAGMRIDAVDADGNSVLRIHLWRDPEDCNMCGALGYHSHAVPWYCGPVAEGESEGGYKTVCARCYCRWEAWDSSLRHAGPNAEVSR
ncbi:hypothetical protein NMQ14_12890 [Methyloversatilis sp. XJ19-13]|uniref:hypothetical protein n=1 Tax=Methyloversatilis sp. XJ19-13 TaxID=2963430 RepID=UPI00211CDF92|nr:hypothetical protein [Methyloversatilis sp. XJ19-13]MCQ9375148.1 hypothetical protein [Methyloversatilis sp. XJ19-13]